MGYDGLLMQEVLTDKVRVGGPDVAGRVGEAVGAAGIDAQQRRQEYLYAAHRRLSAAAEMQLVSSLGYHR